MSIINKITSGGNIGIGHILFVLLLVTITNFFDASAYSSRLAGVRTQKIALSNSLYAMLTVGSRTATMLYLPSIASIIDLANIRKFDPIWTLHIVLFGSTIGTGLCLFLMPTLVDLYSIGIEGMDKRGTFGVLKSLFSSYGFRTLINSYHQPTVEMARNTEIRGKKEIWSLYLLNCFLYALFTIGSFAALYAGIINPNRVAIENQLSGSINGIAAILLLFMIDPRSAIIIDRGISRRIPLKFVRNSMVMLTLGRLTGTFLAQFLLVPGAHLVSVIAQFF